MGDLRHQGVIRIGISKETADAQEHFVHSQSRTPLVLQDVQTDGSIGIDVGMVDSSGEGDLGRLEWIVGRELDVQEEHSMLVRTIFRAHDGSLPVEIVVLVIGACRTVSRRVPLQIQ